MGLVNVPDQRQWLQPNTSVLFGNLQSTHNIDFSLDGFLKLAPRTRYIGQEATSGGNLSYIIGIVYGAFGGTASGFSGTNLYYYINGDDIFVSTEDLDDFGELTNASPPNTATGSTDAVSWEGGLWVTTSSNLANLTAGTWSSATLMSLTASIPHPLCVAFNNLLLVGNGSSINARDSGGSNTTGVVVVPDDFQIQWIRSFNKNVWIGTRNISNGQAKVYQWDGSSENFNNEYDVDCQWIYSGVSWNGNLYIITNDGRLMAFNGAGFNEVGRLPAYTDTITTSDYYFANGFTLGSVAQRGMAIVDGLIHVMINAEAEKAGVSIDATSRLPSGIWVFDPKIGMYHKYGASNTNGVTDFGQMAVSGAGAISPLFVSPSNPSAPDPDVGGTLLFGARVQTGTSSEIYTVGSVTTGENRGYFSTARIESPEIEESWRYAWLKFEQFDEATDKILLKYRTEYRDGLPFTTASTVTYTSSTVFTSTDTGFANVQEGDEVTILTGDGAGSTAHVSSITLNTGTYTVTLDEAITGVAASDVAKVAVDNYHLLTPTVSIANDDGVNVTERHAKITIPIVNTDDSQPAPSEWIQLKAELRGEDIAISSFVLLSETQIQTII